MDKSTLALITGIAALVVPCVPCIGSALYGLCFIATLVIGILAILEEKNWDPATAEPDAVAPESMKAKIGIAVSFIPLILFAIIMVLYCFGVGGLMIMEA